MCPRCTADPRPENFGNDRKCAFDAEGNFTPDNWNCATIEALIPPHFDGEGVVFGDDESFEYTYLPEIGEGDTGWIITSRYKRRGCTSSAIWVGDFYPPRPVTLALVEGLLSHRAAMAAYEASRQ